MASKVASKRSSDRSANAAKAKDDKRQVVIQGFDKKVGLGKRIAEELEQGMLRAACPAGEPLVEGSENYKAYKFQYKRLCTHLRRNAALSDRLRSGDLLPQSMASMSDEALMADDQKTERQQFRQESLQEAMGITAEDSAHWTPSDQFTCPRCENTKCVYIQSFKGYHSHDDNNQEPVITIRCTSCKFLWKEDEVEGGRMAAGSFVQSFEEDTRTAAPSIWAEDDKLKESWLLPASSS
ncbi:TFIIS [Symbiodinium sp. CCMP2592]|nr:TFIIS [Symbiodinium sp. CCMP2592]